MQRPAAIAIAMNHRCGFRTHARSGTLTWVAPVAQLDRVLRFERSGRRFESVRARHSFAVRSGDIGNRLFRTRPLSWSKNRRRGSGIHRPGASELRKVAPRCGAAKTGAPTALHVGPNQDSESLLHHTTQLKMAGCLQKQATAHGSAIRVCRVSRGLRAGKSVRCAE